MKLRITFLICFFVFIGISASYSFTMPDIGFPLKGLIYESLNIPNADLTNLVVSKDTHDTFEFTYQTKKYKALLFPYGAIYMEREGRNPVLLSFDVNEFRLNGHFRVF